MVLFILIIISISITCFAETRTVTNTADSGAGSLRSALSAAVSGDTVEFNIPTTDPGYTTESGASWWRIKNQSSSYLGVNGGVSVLGSSQTSNQGDTNTFGPEIELTTTATNTCWYGFSFNADHVTIEGFTITNFPRQGISINGNYSHIYNNYIGISPKGDRADPNRQGIGLSCAYNRINNNVISGNNWDGIYMYGTSSNEIVGNYIGVDHLGTAKIGNAIGINIDICTVPTINNTIESNIISGNGDGIWADGNHSDLYVNNNVILNNYIGTDKNGTLELGNNNTGISFYHGPNHNLIKGNVVSDNGSYGIRFYDRINYNQIVSNYIGTDKFGTGNLGNSYHGIYIGDPGWIINPSSYNTIGGSGVGNTIAFNGKAAPGCNGICIDGTNNDAFNKISSNSIFSNSGLGIALNNSANQNINYPSIVSAEYSELTDQTTVCGTASINNIIEIFKAEPDPSGSGEGKVFLGSTTAESNGSWSIAVSGLTPSDEVTSTATDNMGNTSVFSQNKPVVTAVFTYRPDLAIATLESGSDYIGENISDPSGEGQTMVQYSYANQKNIFYVLLNNSGALTDDLIVTGESGASGWDVKYFDGKSSSTEITSQVTSGGWSSGDLASGVSREIRVEIVPSGSGISTEDVMITLTSSNDTQRKDVVKAVSVVVNTAPAISLILPNGGEALSGGNNYNIIWSCTDPNGFTSEPISIYYSTNEGASYLNVITSEYANSGSYSWFVPHIKATNVRIKIVAENLLGNIASDESDASFTISPCKPYVNPVTSPTNIIHHTITGTMSAYTLAVKVNGSTSGVETWLSSCTWEYNASLSSGVNDFSFQAVDIASNESDPLNLSILLQGLSFSSPGTGTSTMIPIGASTIEPTISATVFASSANDLPGPPPSGVLLFGNAIDFISNVSSFSLPIYITMPLSGGVANPIPYYWDNGTSSWKNSGLSVTSKTNSSITFTTNHLSIYAIFGVTGLLSGVRVYPSPYKIGDPPNGVIFDQLAGNETIRIYTISGELVRSQNVSGASWTWNIKNDSGQLCARGIYPFIISNPDGDKRTGKIAIINKG